MLHALWHCVWSARSAIGSQHGGNADPGQQRVRHRQMRTKSVSIHTITYRVTLIDSTILSMTASGRRLGQFFVLSTDNEWS
jgi:hypothetical protein